MLISAAQCWNDTLQVSHSLFFVTFKHTRVHNTHELTFIVVYPVYSAIHFEVVAIKPYPISTSTGYWTYIYNGIKKKFYISILVENIEKITKKKQ